MKNITNKGTKKTVKKNENKEKSILLQLDESTKGIMEEIQSGISDDIIETILEQRNLIKELNEKIDETYTLEKENNKLLKKIIKKIEDLEVE